MSTAVWQVTGLAIFAVALSALGVWILVLHRDSPEKRERQRRLTINERGRLADGTVTDVGPNVLYYSYCISGVEYRTSQDLSQIAQLMPADPERLIGPVTLKYSPRNPANSIVLCESWSGLRTMPAKEKVPNDVA